MPANKRFLITASTAAALIALGVVRADESVIAPGEIHHCTNFKDWALTFDDGPDPTSTPVLLDLLKKNNIKATFFIVGSLAAANPDIIKRQLAEGHQIGSHSWDHSDVGLLAQSNPDGARLQVSKPDDTFNSIAGFIPNYFRMPFGSFTPESDAIVKGEFNKKPVYWNVDTKDYDIYNTTPDKIFTDTPVQIASGLDGGGLNGGPITLQHDLYIPSINEVQKIIDWGRANGYTFKTVSECTGAGAPFTIKDQAKFSAIVGTSQASSGAGTGATSSAGAPGYVATSSAAAPKTGATQKPTSNAKTAASTSGALGNIVNTIAAGAAALVVAIANFF